MPSGELLAPHRHHNIHESNFFYRHMIEKIFTNHLTEKLGKVSIYEKSSFSIFRYLILLIIWQYVFFKKHKSSFTCYKPRKWDLIDRLRIHL